MLQRAMRACGQRFGLQTLLLGYLLLLCFATPGFALPAGAGKAAAQASASSTQVELEGELEVLHEDDFKNKKSRTRHFLNSKSGERYELKAKGRFPHLLSGSKIRVKGTQDGNQLALDSSGGTNLQVLAQPSLTRMGAQKTAVFLVTYQDNPVQPMTASAVQDLLFNTVNNFYRENSYQQAWLSGTVFGWYTIPVPSSNCDVYAISNAAKNAALAAGADLSAYTNFVYMFPKSACFTWAGLADIGGNPSNAWINGSFTLRTVGHELGHTFGLLHAQALNCDVSPIASNCNSITYGDPADIMGSALSGHINAVYKETLGWLNNGSTPPITTVDTSGSYTLDPYETNTANTKALKILKSIDPTTGKKTWYYIEYRQPQGYDSDLNQFTNMAKGVTIRLGADDINEASNLLDMTFNSIATTSIWSNSDHEDGALLVGNRFTDTAAGMTISATWANASGAGVDISFAQASCTRVKPTVLISPSQSTSVVSGTPVSYTVTVTNNDSSGCGSSTFNLQSVIPSGWSVNLATSTLTVNPGNVGSTTLTTTSSSNALAGSYNIGVSATNVANTSFSGTGSASYSIGSTSAAALATSISTDKSSYVVGSTVTLTVSASSGGMPLANANITFKVTKPNGSVATQTTTTGSNGQAVYKLRLNKQKDPVGTYQASSTAAVNGSLANASTSFAVQ
ncbi:NEW3 domain-containing protein [Vogesella indigofera]|uniref:NEW3 domain-containing protein n=1 Tax=Vogesella indigofera TaxID=45465 RepID=UPI00234F168D|nr:NEW3 domain-containing protein [Vogesella indigofera]MDC7708640.1 NEW3 domain-containing protein [Vogesella indigofera]